MSTRPQPSTLAPPPAATAPRALPVVPANKFLERVHAFAGFKKLTPSLDVELPTQMTIVFGKNASGKSSLCEALKLLASGDPPQKPIKNLHAQFPGTASFQYQFRGQPLKTWSDGDAYGTESNALKYFDSTIAMLHTTEALRPRSIVEVAVFRLEVFDYARTIVTALQALIQKLVTDTINGLQRDLDALLAELSGAVDVSRAPSRPTSSNDATALRQLIDGVEPFGSQHHQRADELRRLEAQLVSASTDEGLQALRARAGLVGQLLQQLNSLQALSTPSTLLDDLQNKEGTLAEKRTAAHTLNEEVFGVQTDPKSHHSLIAAAAGLRDLNSLAQDAAGCPLCRQGVVTCGSNTVPVIRSLPCLGAPDRNPGTRAAARGWTSARVPRCRVPVRRLLGDPRCPPCRPTRRSCGSGRRSRGSRAQFGASPPLQATGLPTGRSTDRDRCRCGGVDPAAA